MKLNRKIFLFAGLIAVFAFFSCEKEIQEEGYYDWFFLAEKPQLYSAKVNDEYGFINKSGVMIIQAQFKDCQYYLVNNIAWARNDDEKEGYIDGEGNWIIQPTFNSAYNFQGDYARVVLNNGNRAIINKSGGIVFTLPEGWYGYGFVEGMIRFRNNDRKYGFYNSKGEIVIEGKYDYLYDFTEGLANFEVDGEYGFINKNDQIVIFPDYDNAHFFHEGLAGVEKDNKWGFINNEGETKIDFKYDWAGAFFEGVSWVELNDKMYIINKAGETRNVNEDIDSWKSFSEDMAAFKSNNNEWGFVNKEGKTIIPPQYANAAYFYGGIAYVEFEDGSEAYIDKTGNIIWKGSVTKSKSILSKSKHLPSINNEYPEHEAELMERLKL